MNGKQTSAIKRIDRLDLRPSATRQATALVVCLGITFLAAAAGGALTSLSVNGWYRTLAKPSWNPPDWVFGPVWTLLYALMAVAAWLVWRRSGWIGARLALTLFAVQLVLNVAWSGVFFGLQRPAAALVEILVLIAAIFVTLALFARHSSLAAALLAPYLAWTLFAAVLCYEIARLNP